jgi:hypothetical protein
MSMEETGTYWTLLVRQMVDGYLFNDLGEYLKFLNVRSVEDAQRLLTPRVARKFHVADCKADGCAGWSACAGTDPSKKLFNSKLVETIQEMNDDSWRNKNNISNRYKNDFKTAPIDGYSSNTTPKEVEETPTFSFNELLTVMPKRKVKGTLDGWEQGKAMLKYITTQEEYNDLLAATKAYARQRKGEDPAYHISLFNWVTKEYHRFVPPKTEAPVEEAKPVGFTPPAAPAVPQKRIPKDWCVPEGLTLAKPLDTPPPWIVDENNWEAKQAAKRAYPNDAAKHKWWTTPSSTDNHAGA